MCHNLQAQMESNHDVESAQLQVDNVHADEQAEDSMEEESQHPKIIASETELEDKVMSQDSELLPEELAEVSELENIYKLKKPLEIPEEDLDMASNFLNGERHSRVLINIY